MTAKIKKFFAIASLALIVGFGAFALPVGAEDPTSAEEAVTLIETVTEDLGEVIWDGLALALVIIGALMGLMFVYRFVRNRISSPK